MTFEKLQKKDIDSFIEMRMAFVALLNSDLNINEFKSTTKTYITEHFDKDDLFIYVCKDNDKIVSSCMACIYTAIPLPSRFNGKTAELLNVYTLDEYRRRGLVSKLIKMLMEDVKKHGTTKMVLDYTQMGHPVYQKLGFNEVNNIMEIKL